MKTILFSAIFALGIMANGYGHNENEHGDKYCAETRDGRTTVMHKGNTITADVTLDNGWVLKSDGTVIKKDGSRMTLKDGECINRNGKVYDKKDMNRKKDPK